LEFSVADSSTLGSREEHVVKQLVAFLVGVGLAFASVPSALGELRSYTRKYTYEASPLDSEFSGQVIAKAYVKGMILDAMGLSAKALLEGWGYPYDAEYTKAMMSCLSEVKVLKEKRQGNRFLCKARTRADITRILMDFGTFEKEQIPKHDILASREAANAALLAIEEMKKNLASSAGEAGNQEAYNGAVNRLHAADWYERARYAGFTKDYDEAFDAYTKTIELNPEFAGAYHFRGLLYGSYRNERGKARSDLDTAAKLYCRYAARQRESEAYGSCVGVLGMVLRITREDPDVYYERALCNIGLERHQEADRDFREAALLGHEGAREILTARGVAW